MPKDYLPKKMAEYNSWGINFFEVLEPNIQLWKVDPTEAAAVKGLFLKWQALYLKHLQPAMRTTPLRIERDEAYEKLDRRLRAFNQAYLIHSLLVSDQDRARLGLNVPKSPKAKAGRPPVTMPEFTVDTSVIGQLTVHFRDRDEKGHAKPKDADEIVIVYGILDHVPVDPKELTQWITESATPCEIKFEGKHRGDPVYLAACWKNKHGRGPWTEIQHGIVP
ncbi:MAG: hypothetical protein LBK22_05055 [Tannerella sp.]|nr:hypothetical protein [Tannerella sp.]